MTLTPRGRTLLVFAIAFGLAGRILALRELSVAGAAMLVILAVGTVSVWLRRGEVTVARTVRPRKTTAGAEVTIDLRVHSRGGSPGAPLLLREGLPAVFGNELRLTVERGRTGRDRSVTYILRPPVRGSYQIGPVDVIDTDPFGAIQRVRPSAGTASVLVYPSFERVRTLPVAVQRLGVIRRSPDLGQGDEFYALREYIQGDDLRKIHWPTSLRRGELLVRQEELLGEPKAVLILDTCARKHRGTGADASIEAAISACASLAALTVERRMRLQIVTPDGPLLHTRRPTHDEVLEALALLTPSERTDLTGAFSHLDLRRGGTTAVGVVITPGLGEHEAAILAGATSQVGAGAVVHVETSGFDAAPYPAGVLGRLGLPVLRLGRGGSFRAAWERGVKDVPVAR